MTFNDIIVVSELSEQFMGMSNILCCVYQGTQGTF